MTRRRPLSGHEQTLWATVTKGVTPMHTGTTHDAPVARPPASRNMLGNGRNTAVPTVPPQKISHLPKSKTHPARSVLGGGDPALDRHAAKGRIPIERRLDLHGDTQTLAYSRLHRFILDAYADGCRCVLIVTGKGGPASASSMARARLYNGHDDRDHFSPKGILKQRFLEWVDTPDLRLVIARASAARPKDGGAGAFYVFLKKQKR